MVEQDGRNQVISHVSNFFSSRFSWVIYSVLLSKSSHIQPSLVPFPLPTGGGNDGSILAHHTQSA